MPKKSNKRSHKGKKTRKQKQKPIVMVGCSKKNKKSCKKSYKKHNFLSSSKLSDNKSCPNCGPNCHCGPSCNCPHPCPGTCYLNRRSHKGGSGCGSCGCPISPMSWSKMNQFGGYKGPTYTNGEPVIISPPQKGYVPILGIAQNGGSCSACGQTPVVPAQSGGNFFKQIGPMPGPTVGSAWGGNINKWPGVDGIGSNRNFLKPYDTNNDPQQQMSMNNSGYKTLNSMVGGYRYSPKKTKTSSLSASTKNKKGGALIPQDLINLGRDLTFNLGSAYNALNGYKAPVNPIPYKDQLTGQNM